jgi:transcriptional regulator GlxA family with amidase domain
LSEKEGFLSLQDSSERPQYSRMKTHLPERAPAETSRSRRIGFLMFPDCEILDVCGPLEAFFWADHWLGRLGSTAEPGDQSVLISTTRGPIRTLSGVEMVATHSYTEISNGLDTLVVAGGRIEEVSKDEALVGWVRSIAPRTRRVASVCSGAFILAAAGLLHQRRATTHWLYSDLLASSYSSIVVDATKVFIRDGNIYTSGGITSGIDLALGLVEEDVGPEIMLSVARTMVVFPRRPGGQSQFSAYTCGETEKTYRTDFSELRTWMMAHPEADLSVPALADRMAMSPRNFSRTFRGEMGETPAQFTEKVRAEAARCKLEQTLLPVEKIAKDCGFGDPERMRRTFQRLYEISPADYRARFRSTQIARTA